MSTILIKKQHCEICLEIPCECKKYAPKKVTNKGKATTGTAAKFSVDMSQIDKAVKKNFATKTQKKATGQKPGRAIDGALLPFGRMSEDRLLQVAEQVEHHYSYKTNQKKPDFYMLDALNDELMKRGIEEVATHI